MYRGASLVYEVLQVMSLDVLIRALVKVLKAPSAHQKAQPPQGHHRALSMGLR